MKNKNTDNIKMLAEFVEQYKDDLNNIITKYERVLDPTDIRQMRNIHAFLLGMLDGMKSNLAEIEPDKKISN